eukprot:10924437-Alexandrium_andersonii.AAC.1
MPVESFPELVHRPLHLSGGAMTLVGWKAYPSIGTLEFGLDICLLRISDFREMSLLCPVGVSNP